MIEPPPDLTTDAIVARVRDRYALDVDEATFLPQGSSWSFRLDGGGVQRFLKVLRHVGSTAIELPRLLAARGIEHLVPTISTRDGSAVDRGEPYTFALFPFIDGVAAGEIGLTPAQREELGRFLRALHETLPDDALTTLLPRERFVVRDEAYIDGANQTIHLEAPDEIAATLLATWDVQRSEIAYALTRARELAAYGARSGAQLVPCHADFHAWNVLIEQSGDLRIIDWDEALLAPRERDLMFVSGETADIDPSGEDFFEGYGEVRADPVLIAYYRFDWVLQEVADYRRRVFDVSLGEATRADALTGFAKLFGPEDVVVAAHHANDMIR